MNTLCEAGLLGPLNAKRCNFCSGTEFVNNYCCTCGTIETGTVISTILDDYYNVVINFVNA